MQCPKDKATLDDSVVAEELMAKRCPQCTGIWITAGQYRNWQEQRGPESARPERATIEVPDIQFEPSPLDAKGALCPDCGHYLSRARVGTTRPFYIERCANCGGIWCDGGEWDVLEESNLSVVVPFLFSETWQARRREREHAEHERHELQERLGPELAERVSLFASELRAHPHGDYVLAYLMRVIKQLEEPV